MCQKKLKQNLGFDCGERFKNLAIVCEDLGFTEEAEIYRNILKQVESGTGTAGITVNRLSSAKNTNAAKNTTTAKNN